MTTAYHAPHVIDEQARAIDRLTEAASDILPVVLDIQNSRQLRDLLIALAAISAAAREILRQRGADGGEVSE